MRVLGVVLMFVLSIAVLVLFAMCMEGPGPEL
jgi:hypothetical protein